LPNSVAEESATMLGLLSKKMMYISKHFIFQAGFAGQGILYKDPTV
jgi:hypothetical protein